MLRDTSLLLAFAIVLLILSITIASKYDFEENDYLHKRRIKRQANVKVKEEVEMNGDVNAEGQVSATEQGIREINANDEAEEIFNLGIGSLSQTGNGDVTETVDSSGTASGTSNIETLRNATSKGILESIFGIGFLFGGLLGKFTPEETHFCQKRQIESSNLFDKSLINIPHTIKHLKRNVNDKTNRLKRQVIVIGTPGVLFQQKPTVIAYRLNSLNNNKVGNSIPYLQNTNPNNNMVVGFMMPMTGNQQAPSGSAIYGNNHGREIPSHSNMHSGLDMPGSLRMGASSNTSNKNVPSQIKTKKKYNNVNSWDFFGILDLFRDNDDSKDYNDGRV